MTPARILTLVLVALCAIGLLAAGEVVGVGGSRTQYATLVEARVGDETVTLRLTGTALRQRYLFNVYTVGSYVQAGVTVAGAEELAAADCPKLLHLVMERDVDGKDLAEAFTTAIRRSHAAPAFAEELALLDNLLRGLSVKKGDHVRLTHVPKVGMHGALVGKTEFLIKNVAFSRAVWEIYLGPSPVTEPIKRGLVSRL
jgi:Chalcone isomerase-like